MPSEAAASLPSGVRLKVPFGKREVIGYLLDIVKDSDVPQDTLKRASEVLDTEPALDSTLCELARWAADYYHHPVGEVYSALLPKRLREGKSRQRPGEPGWQLSNRGKGLPPDALARSPKQCHCLNLLREAGPLNRQQLKEAGITSAVTRALHDKDLIEAIEITSTPKAPSSRPGLSLSPEQSAAVEAVEAVGDTFQPFLLEGITGSGKTEVYLQLIAKALTKHQQALVLIPEIGLTPQTLARFKQRFDARIVVLHSGLTDAQRYNAWEEARAGLADIIIGTRSAVFTPMARPGMIIVDEEHDGSFKQQDGFRYNARDVAVKRAQLHQCPVLLGSATPSLESCDNADRQRYQRLTLTQRAGNAALPQLQAIDVRHEALQAGLGSQLLAAMQETLHREQQVLLFLNRRGYAPSLQCHDCGWVANCDNCDARFTVHRRQRRLRCHHCGKTQSLPQTCPGCHSGQLLTNGLGTEQTEDFLHQHFSRWPIHRVDSDSMQGRHAMDDLVATINQGEPCILLGTQMLTKGHHFPGVTLVAVIDADAMLFSADFRGEERMAQLLTQVAGRAGRAEAGGRVIVQTHYPDHPVLQAILYSSYAEQSQQMLTQRQATGMPPAGQLVIIRTDCKDANYGEAFLQTLRHATQPHLPAGAQLIGPLPSPMQRRAGKFRSQLLLNAPNRAIAQQAASLLVTQAEKAPARLGLKWSIDIDPQDMF